MSIDLSGVPDIPAVTSALQRAVPGTALYFFDRHLRIILAGGPALMDAGFSPDQLEGRLVAEVVPADIFALMAPHYETALDSGEPSSFEMTTPDGRYRVDVAPVRNESGAVIGLYAFARAQ